MIQSLESFIMQWLGFVKAIPAETLLKLWVVVGICLIAIISIYLIAVLVRPGWLQ